MILYFIEKKRPEDEYSEPSDALEAGVYRYLETGPLSASLTDSVMAVMRLQ